jgi:hypothetical protein
MGFLNVVETRHPFDQCLADKVVGFLKAAAERACERPQCWNKVDQIRLCGIT